MPTATRATVPTEPDRLRPYVFHGIHLSPSGSHAIGDCPFCGREGKFSVDVATGLWRCWVCGSGTAAGGGNGLVFVRLIHERAAAANVGVGKGVPTFLAKVALDRKLLSADTVRAWGIAQAADGAWLVPGYGTDGKMDQVYRRTHVKDKDGWVWRLLPTPGIWPEGKAHALHLPIGDFDPSWPAIVVCEGPWDAMALWEVWDRSTCANNIVAVPGCNVWRDEWTQLCRGKHVTLMFDSDHPHEYAPGKVSRAGYDGMARVARRLSGIAASVRYLKWGPDGYDPEKPSGWDVRDHLTSGGDSDPSRGVMLSDLLGKVEDAPREWFNPSSTIVNGQPHHAGSVEAMSCSSWRECEEAWDQELGGAMYWRSDLSDALAVLLAICASTPQAGNQLFLDLIGAPGSAKTTLCKGLLVSGHCIQLENMTKIISGYKHPDDKDKDCSFLARSNGKTWVTCEFDVLGSSPQYHELMGKVRRIFDGETSATYGNSDVDRLYTALRTPWVRAGTHRMMDRMADYDQSQLGDRFLRLIISDPSSSDRRNIARAALRLERAAMMDAVNGMAGSVEDPKTRRAHALTGGYVDWLRANIEEKLAQLDTPTFVEDYCIDLAELCADLRARPCEDKRKVETHDSKEMPTRLARQNIRLASCLAVVLNKFSIDTEVLRIVRKVALDTASGNSLNMVHWLCAPNPKDNNRSYQEGGGIFNGYIESWTKMSSERTQKYLNFLRNIGVVEFREIKQSHGAWLLTDRVYDLYLRVMKG